MIGVLSETQERFFKAIAKQLPLERIIELHLFQPIRQGGMESGVAVIAAVPEGEALAPPEPAPDAREAREAADSAAHMDAPDEPGTLDAVGAASGDDVEKSLDDVVETEAGELRRADRAPSAAAHGAEDGEAESTDETVEEVIAEPVPDEVSDVAPEALAEAVADVEHLETPEAVTMAQASTEMGDQAMEIAAAITEHPGAPIDEDDVEPAAAPRPRRYTVYTARYRHVLKGPDRGKWEVSVVAEADAPLLTVDVVVRGVLRRSGDAGEPERLTGDDVRRALRLPAPAPV